MRDREEYIIDSLDRFRLPSGRNLVICEVEDKNDHIKLSNGSKIYLDTTWEKSEHADRVMRVVSVPEHLVYDTKQSSSMEWETEVEVEEGDEVLISYLHSLNCPILKVKEKEYYLVHYSEIYCTKRGKEIIPCNGRVVMEEVVEEEKVLAYSVNKLVNKGKVRYLGRPNKRYTYGGYTDEIDLEVGDVVVMDNERVHIITEHPTHARFFGGEVMFVTQRKNIIAKL